MAQDSPSTSAAVPSSKKSNGPAGSRATSRLLYRGSLSLPDSYLLLDGLTFTIDLPADDPQASLKLLETPLPLALESMRGRPSLKFIAVEPLDKLHWDFSEDVNLHIHPNSILTRHLFTNNLCAAPVKMGTGRTELGIRIRLGDATDLLSSLSNDIIIYGQPHPSSTVMRLRVARITPPPLPLPRAVTNLRPPRPDDPTPRKPPQGFLGVGMKRGSGSESGKERADGRTNKKTKIDLPEVLRNKIGLTRSTSLNASLKAKIVDAGKNARPTFKVPSLPKKLTRLEEEVLPPEQAKRGSVSEVESANKALIKKAAIRLLCEAGVSKQHESFKELYNFSYRGACFALRSKMNANLDKDGELIDRIVNLHVKLYIAGDGSYDSDMK